MAVILLLTIALSCLSSISATYDKSGPSKPKFSPLAQDEPVVLHSNRPLLITRTIQELPEEKVRPLIRIFVPRPATKVLKLHELRDLELPRSKIADSHHHIGHVGPVYPKMLHYAPRKILLTEPLILDHGHRSLHNELIHEGELLDDHLSHADIHHLSHADIHHRPAISFIEKAPHYPALLPSLPHRSLALHEKSIVRGPIIPIHSPHLKYIQPGY